MSLDNPAAVMARLAEEQRLCECGCGKPTKIAARTNRCWGHVKGQPLRFIVGHSGAANGNKVWYQDGRSKRWIVTGRDGKNYLWYRILMENEVGRPLARDETVHHINGDQTDDRVENLTLMSRSEHGRLHATERMTPERAREMGRLGLLARYGGAIS